ncbi:MAG TPA: hypothetical protein VHC70_00275 [Phycisphaerales bacterium]|nr:hypothetical protein [Phycisphaerales bacterium]
MTAASRQNTNGAFRASGQDSSTRAGAAQAPEQRRLIVEDVVVVDKHTGEPLGEILRPEPHASDAEMFRAEEKTPDGPGANPHERRVWPWVMVGLGAVGLIGVGVVMYLHGGWDSAAVGLTWVGMGYAVAWIVVWAAGLMRAKEEREIELEIDQRHRQQQS